MDVQSLQHLYNSLYVEKYSSLNPAYNTRFFDLVIKSKAVNLVMVKDGDVPEGMAGYISGDGWMISPLFGYDPVKQDNKGIYRYLSAYLLYRANEDRLIFNQSAGGSFFKKIRRAQLHVEYIAVDFSHLPFTGRAIWSILSSLSKSIGLKIMQRY